ncbi:MAG: ammonia-forming cytochrome c nitrite reductase subunit c552 [Anaerolineales bacterium]|jgi:nitrite reductase (cytochrome c-552)|nr:ammonia-forming cytochrome c nitrite reductase subunit c552 [Anaerolineales bacterium]
MNKTIYILTGIIVVLALGLIGVLIFMNNQPAQTRGIPPIVEIASLEPNSAKWGENFPNQYSTLLLTETNRNRTTFGGSDPYSKLEQDPRLVQLFAGYGFSKDYNEERGHMNALTDVRATLRINETTPGTCYSCKSSNNPELWTKMGMAEYDKMPFAELGKQITQPIGCANCHEAGTMRLVVTNPALENALKAQGLDWTQFTRQEMRTVVCGNCHVEYYFEGDGKFLTFPWVNGRKIENIAQYYQEEGFKDWEHPDSGAPMIKMQHPEFEFFTADSTHYKAGVACADCHMPYTRDGAAKFSNHNVQSPLLNAEAACGQCHTDVAYVTGRVATIQAQVRQTMDATEDAIVAAIGAIKAAAALPAVDATLLAEARDLHRESQLRWDFIAAENSMGFHNPEEALRILADATNLARQAQLKAVQAAGTPDVIQTSGN